MRLDVSYIAKRGKRLTDHWQRMGLAANMNNPAILALGEAVLNSDCNSSVAVNNVCQGVVRLPYASFKGNVAQAFRRFPQYQNINWRDVPTGASLYNALEVVLERRLSRGLQFRLGYTRSHLVTNGAESSQGGEGINATGGVASRSGNFNPATQNYFNKAAWVDPGSLQMGNAPRRDESVRGFPTYSEDVNIFKVFRLYERLDMKFEAQFGNLFNRTD